MQRIATFGVGSPSLTTDRQDPDARRAEAAAGNQPGGQDPGHPIPVGVGPIGFNVDQRPETPTSLVSSFIRPFMVDIRGTVARAGQGRSPTKQHRATTGQWGQPTRGRSVRSVRRKYDVRVASGTFDPCPRFPGCQAYRKLIGQPQVPQERRRRPRPAWRHACTPGLLATRRSARRCVGLQFACMCAAAGG